MLKRKAPSVEDLEGQLQAAKDEVEAAQNALDEAHGRFFDAGDDRSAKALVAAKERRAMADEYVIRAERLLAEGRERQEAQRLRELDEQIETARTAMAKVLEGEAPHIQAEAELIVQLAEVRAKRWAVRTEASKLQPDLHRAYHARWGHFENDRFEVMPSPEPVNDALELRYLAKSKGFDPRQPLVAAAVPTAGSYVIDRAWRAEPMIPFDDLRPIEFAK